MSEASAHKLSYVVETTRGTTPPSPRFRALPDTRTTLALQKENLSSERITGDRFPAEPRTGASTVGGDIPADLSSKAYDEFIASALQGEWVDNTGGQSDSVDLSVGGMVSAAVVVGQTFTTTNGIVTVESIDGQEEETVLTFLETGETEPVTFELFADPVDVDGTEFIASGYTDIEENATVIAGDTRKAFSILREFSDFAAGEEPFFLYSGCEVATWNLTAAANGIAKSTFTFFGRDFVGPSALAPIDSSVAPAFDTEPFDTFSGSMKLDGVAQCIVTDYNMTINNGHAARYTVGCSQSQDPSVTQSLIEGSITAYFENAQLYKKFVNEESLSIELALADSKGNKLIISLPNLRIGSGTQPDVSGDGPVTIPINFTAHKNQALGSHISVQRVMPVAV